jgi:hypothetical protein
VALGVLFLSGAILLLVAPALSAGPSLENGSAPRPSNSSVGVPGAVSCAVLDSNGARVTQVSAMSFGDPGYWLQFRSTGSLATKVRFDVKPLFEGSPAMGQAQRFATDFSDVVTTPFGVPD